mmetsp:Transcript_35343/g.87834  ORF Transcript_35343/g.87834 Transcript_35343/m.87834 type:complete len:225 (+) Transcript_35343:1552-2226(+)
MCVCMSVCLHKPSLYVQIHTHHMTHMHTHLSTCQPSIHPSIQLSIHLSTQPSPAGCVHSIEAGLLHDREELLLVDFAVHVFVELVYHGLQLVIGQVLTQFPSDTPEVLERYAVCVIVVEEFERLADLLVRIPLGCLGRHYFQKVVVVDLSAARLVILLHELQHVSLLDLKTQRTHRYFELVVVDFAALVRVEQIKRLLDLAFLFLCDVCARPAFPPAAALRHQC